MTLRSADAFDAHLLAVPRDAGYASKALAVKGAVLWNTLPKSTREITRLAQFKTKIRTIQTHVTDQVASDSDADSEEEA